VSSSVFGRDSWLCWGKMPRGLPKVRDIPSLAAAISGFAGPTRKAKPILSLGLVHKWGADHGDWLDDLYHTPPLHPEPEQLALAFL